MPVSTGRVSSREAERATRATVSTNASAGSVMRVSAVRRRERAGSPRRAACAGGRSPRPQISSTSCSAARSSSETRLRGQRADDVEQQARGQDHVAGRCDLGASGTRRPTSMSVARSSGAASATAEIITPDSACTALRVEATRVAV